MVTDYLEAIKGFPALPKPEIFGLHENADITCDQNETYNMFSTILALQPRVSAGAGASREDVILQLCESIAEKVGQPMWAFSEMFAFQLHLHTTNFEMHDGFLHTTTGYQLFLCTEQHTAVYV